MFKFIIYEACYLCNAHRQEYEKYWKLYKKYLESDKDVNIKQRLEEWEKSMDVTNILKARAQAKVEVTLRSRSSVND